MTARAPEMALLASGGLDSCVLIAELAERAEAVHPVYIRQGLRWEGEELAAISEFLLQLAHPQVRELQVLEMPVGDAYGSHWSLDGEVPDSNSDDSAVYLPGRNLLLLSKLAVWCDIRGISTIALAPLAGNPFGDNSEGFYRGLVDLLDMALGRRFDILRPYAGLSKAQVIVRGAALPLETTLSCILPSAGQHCGHCNKCAERQRAFIEAEVPDPTVYARPAGAESAL